MPSCFLVSCFELFRVTSVSRSSLVLKYVLVGYLYLFRPRLPGVQYSIVLRCDAGFVKGQTFLLAYHEDETVE
jgi:hypothetical protein